MRIYKWTLPLIGVFGLAGFGWSQLGLDLGKNGEKVESAIPETAVVKPAQERKVLIFTKTNGFRHGSIGIGSKALTRLGEKTGAFTAVHTEDLSFFEEDKLKEFDAVCFFNTTMDVFRPRNFEKLKGEARQDAEETDARLKANLMKFIKSGKGFVGIHAATDTCYEWPEYGEMIGGYFDGHPWTAGTEVVVRIADGQEAHPLNQPIDSKSLNFKEEIYQFKAPYDSKKVHMLLRLDTEKSDMTRRGIKREDKDFGVAWIKKHGEGRVFYCSLGHNNHIFWNERVMGHYLSGFQWALGDLEAPMDLAGAN